MPILTHKILATGRYLAVAVCLAPLLLLGCAGTPWKPAAGPIGANHYEIDIPQNWLRLDGRSNLMLTKDGPYLQYILVQARPLKRPFRYTGQTVTAHMLPSDAAQVILDEIGSDPSVSGIQLHENAPALIDNHEGFKIVFSYYNSEGLKLRTLYYGCIHAGHLFSLRFTAAQRHYFEKDRPDFDRMLASFKLQ